MGLLKRVSPYFQMRDKNETYIIVSFALLTGWVISFPYEGPVLYGLITNASPVISSINSYNLLLLAVGLFVGGILPVPPHLAKKTLLSILTLCFIGSLALLVISNSYWVILIPLLSCAVGIGMSLYGHQVKNHVPRQRWSLVAPDTMVLACIVTVTAQILVAIVSVALSFVFIEIILCISIILLYKVDTNKRYKYRTKLDFSHNIIKSFWLLFVFIFIVSINAGIMFHAIFPAFAKFEILVSIYTNVPYIGAIILLSKIYKGNKFNYLYVGLALWGISLLIFPHLSPSHLAFIILASCMLFAAGIFDLFWWMIFTTSFDYVKKPATMFGAVLSVNVLGSLVGGLLSNFLTEIGTSPGTITQLGILTIMLNMVLIVPLNKKISPLFASNDFLEKQHWNRMEDSVKAVRDKLSSREMEVYDLLLAGMSDKKIGDNLNISLNTVKSHNRKIYNKLEVKNRIELKHYFNGLKN